VLVNLFKEELLSSTFAPAALELSREHFPLQVKVFLCQRLNAATSSPADDVHHYVIPHNLLDSIFNKLPVFIRQWGKEKGVLYPLQVPPSQHAAFMLPQWQGNRVLNLREINRNNTHTALASVLTYYGRVSLIFLVSSL
jgi:hypothetical protein